MLKGHKTVEQMTIEDDRVSTQLAPCCFTCEYLTTNYKTAHDECKRDGNEPTYYYDLGDRIEGLARFTKKCPQWECFPQEEN